MKRGGRGRLRIPDGRREKRKREGKDSRRREVEEEDSGIQTGVERDWGKGRGRDRCRVVVLAAC